MKKVNRKIILYLALLIVTGCAASARLDESQAMSVVDFEREILRIVEVNKEHLQLTKIERPEAKTGFVLYSDKPPFEKNELSGKKRTGRSIDEMYVTVHCNDNVLFEIRAQNSEVGFIMVSDCTDKRGELEKLSEHQLKHVDLFLESFGKVNEEVGDPRKVGWFYRRTYLPGVTVHQFPVFLVGHGLFWPLTTLAFSNRNDQLYVLQFEFSRLCNWELEQCIALSKVATDGILEFARKEF